MCCHLLFDRNLPSHILSSLIVCVCVSVSVCLWTDMRRRMPRIGFPPSTRRWHMSIWMKWRSWALQAKPHLHGCHHRHSHFCSSELVNVVSFHNWSCFELVSQTIWGLAHYNEKLKPDITICWTTNVLCKMSVFMREKVFNRKREKRERTMERLLKPRPPLIVATL